jgi:hypothetical protein
MVDAIAWRRLTQRRTSSPVMSRHLAPCRKTRDVRQGRIALGRRPKSACRAAKTRGKSWRLERAHANPEARVFRTRWSATCGCRASRTARRRTCSATRCSRRRSMGDTASRTLHRAREDRRGLARVPAFVESYVISRIGGNTARSGQRLRELIPLWDLAACIRRTGPERPAPPTSPSRHGDVDLSVWPSPSREPTSTKSSSSTWRPLSHSRARTTGRRSAYRPGGFGKEAVSLHRRLQRHHGQAVSLDLSGQTPCRLSAENGLAISTAKH